MLKRCKNGHLIWLLAGLERDGKSAAIAYTLIETAKLNGVDPQAWFTDVLSRVADQDRRVAVMAVCLI